ncbi:hypothetical protein PNEG_03427 [Pneumocystis murina B123]|uniref:Man1/Src1 C-terminal domain-containing protein n=1 Tax=Pneumocystis murina (strain B123) TaxID=1069680 RepID=M7P368_PNEMU|nr:hypothetical protein PNEG_03427 [Pneumocystis murina B123]EMR08260.1 hypothetical protein PNEG_03427 [Pneumocystis murina B123]
MLQDYLDENFDAKSLRIADLRRILFENNVNYPSSAKKQVLLDLFYEHIVLGKKGYLKEKKHENKDEYDILSDNISKIKQVKQKSSKKKGKKQLNDSKETLSANRYSHMSLRRSISDQPSNIEDKEKLEEKSLSLDEGFSNENFFQQTSPLCETYKFRSSLQPLMPEAHQKEVVDILEVPEKSSIMRVKPELRSKSLVQPLMNTTLPRSKPKKFMTNIENLKTSQQFYHMTMYSKPDNELTTQTSENNEFTHNDLPLNNNETESKDKLDLNKEVLNVFYGKSKVKPKRKKFSFIRFFVVFIFSTSIATLGSIWREETIRVGYCGVEIKEIPNTYSLIRGKLPRILLNNLFVYCKPCPDHAICYPNFKLVCQKDYILTPNILSFNGLIPIVPSCIPDTEKLRRVHIIINEIIQMLRDKNAKLECGSSKLLKGEKEGIYEKDLEKYLWEMKSPDIDDQQFQELLSDAFEDIVTYDEIHIEKDGYIDLIDQKDILNQHLFQTFHLDAHLKNISDEDWYAIESSLLE